MLLPMEVTHSHTDFLEALLMRERLRGRGMGNAALETRYSSLAIPERNLQVHSAVHSALDIGAG